jgi:hypothetical protein
LIDGFHGARDDLGRIRLRELRHQILQTLVAEHFAVGILRFYNAVRVSHQKIA